MIYPIPNLDVGLEEEEHKEKKMADANQEQKVDGNEDGKYLQEVVNKLNANDPTLTRAERILIQKVVAVQKDVDSMAQKFVQLDNEINEKKTQMTTLNQQIILKKGQSQGLIESLLALRLDEDESEEQPV